MFSDNVFLNKILLIVINYVNSYDFSTLWQTRRNVQLKDQTLFETILERYILLSNCVLYIFPPPSPPLKLSIAKFLKNVEPTKRVLTRFHVWRKCL